jgi:hypothetical protein
MACAFVVVVLVGQGLGQASLWAGALGLPVGLVGLPVGLVAAGATVWATLAPQPRALVPPELAVQEWVVNRPAELSEVVTRLVGGRGGTAGITTALHGAGGFGKTTLALVVCADRRIRRRFGRYVYWVTVGRDARGAPALAAKVNDVIKLVAGEDATFTDPELERQGSNAAR